MRREGTSIGSCRNSFSTSTHPIARRNWRAPGTCTSPAATFGLVSRTLRYFSSVGPFAMFSAIRLSMSVAGRSLVSLWPHSFFVASSRLSSSSSKLRLPYEEGAT